MDKNKVIAGRTYQEILERFSMKINDPRRSSRGKINTKIIKEFLKIKCPLEKAPKILNSFFKKYSLNIIVGKDYFPIQKKNNKNLKVEFLASNGRELEIYSSIVFSIDVKIKSKVSNFILGGRYDRLTENLGFKKVPAVGAAINMGVYE